jgi:hypothetical protein
MSETETPVQAKRPSRAEAHCSVEGCKRPFRAKSYCNVHYAAWRRGEIEGHRARYKICTKEGCRKPRATGSFCAEHAAKDKD